MFVVKFEFIAFKSDLNRKTHKSPNICGFCAAGAKNREIKIECVQPDRAVLLT